MISVLIPSRARARMLGVALESLGKTDYEALVWVDDDDPQLEEYMSLPATVFIRPRVGYVNFHLMVNYLAKKAKGNWLLLFNDDMRIETPDWTDRLESYDSRQPLVLNFWDPANKLNNLAPAISRKLYKVMGHYSLNTHCDSWVQDIANDLGFHQPVWGLKTSHLREVLNDETKQQTQSVYPTSSPHYDSPEVMLQRRADAKKIKESL